MDATQWPQVRLARSMEEIIPTNNNLPPPVQQGEGGGGLDSNNNQRRLSRPQKDQSLNCPRCNSTNTKFCYYNNYSLTQPRYFCKACRRYWTQGGSLRNVPVGGGSRKNKRSTPPSSSSSSVAPSSSPNTIPNMIPDLNPLNTFSHFITPLHQNPSNKIHPHPHAHHHHGQDLNLAFPTSTMMNQSMEANKVELPNSSCSTPFSALELLRTGMSSSSSLSSQFAMPDSNPLYTSSGFPNLQEMKPGFMGFPSPAHGLELGPSFSVGSLQENNHQNVKLLFPFGDVNKFSSHQNAATNTTRNDQVDDRQSIKGSTQDHHHHHGASGYWNGMLGGTW